jgi:hypothetical protein
MLSIFVIITGLIQLISAINLYTRKMLIGLFDLGFALWAAVIVIFGLFDKPYLWAMGILYLISTVSHLKEAIEQKTPVNKHFPIIINGIICCTAFYLIRKVN